MLPRICTTTRMADKNYMDRARNTIEQTSALLFGVVFLIVGIAGFIPGATTDFDRVSTIGGEGAHLLGIIGVNWLENLVHLAYAAAGLWAATNAVRSRQYFLWGGAIYGVVWLYGMLIDLQSDANLIGLNDASNWLHLALAVTMVAMGFYFTKNRDAQVGA